MSNPSPFDNLTNQLGQTVTVVLPDGTNVTAVLTNLELTRDSKLVRPEDLIPANIELPPDFDSTPQWVVGPAVASITLEAREGTP